MVSQMCVLGLEKSVTGLANLSARLKAHLAAFVHPSVMGDATEAAKHTMFIYTRMSTSVLAIAAVPLFLALRGVPALWQTLAFIWMVLPLAAVALVSRTGRMLQAQMVCVISLIGLSSTFAVGGGLGVALSWLLLVPVEAALTMNTVAILVSSALTVVTACGLYLAQVNGLMPEVYVTTPLQLVGLLLPGIVYGATLAQLAVDTHQQHRKAELIGAARLQSLTDTIGDLVMRHDRHGNVVFANEESVPLFGLQPHEIKGRGFFEQVHVADRPAFLKAIGDAAYQGTTVTATLRLRKGPAGSSMSEPVFAWIELRARRLVLDARIAENGDEPGAVLAMVRDITMLKQREQEIEAARTKAEEASIWKDRFLANISHELRTPLNAIIGFSEMLGSDELKPIDPCKQREYAHIIHESGQHLLSVVNTILDMSKIEAGSFELTPEPFDVSTLVSQCCDILSLRARQGGVELVRDLPANLEELVADKRACKQILLNLMSNSVKFTKPGGRITIGVRPDGNSLRIYVSDTGIGIVAGDLPRLGIPFFQATNSYDRAYEGTGLGLSVVRGLVGLHGGDIRIESAPKAGTCITIRFPLDCRQSGRASGGPAKIETFARPVPVTVAPLALNLMGMKKSA